MKVFCLENFKSQFDKLKKKNSYASIEKDIISYFLNQRIEDLKSGTRLNNSDEMPYIKKRLNGSGGFRVYYLLIIRSECMYLLFVHPKTGSMGFDNITDESKALLYKTALECISSNYLYEVKTENGRLVFDKLS